MSFMGVVLNGGEAVMADGCAQRFPVRRAAGPRALSFTAQRVVTRVHHLKVREEGRRTRPQGAHPASTTCFTVCGKNNLCVCIYIFSV